jgi:hypothetical protein
MARLGGLALGGARLLHVDALGSRPGDGLARGVRFVALGLARLLDRFLALRRASPRPAGGSSAASTSAAPAGSAARLDLALLAGDSPRARLEPAQALLQLGDLAADAVAQRLVVGDLAGQAVVLGLGRRRRPARRRAPARPRRRVVLADPLLLEPGALAVEIGDRGLGIALAAALALEVASVCCRRVSASCCAWRRARPRRSAHRAPRAGAAGGRGGGLVVAQRRQRGRGLGLRRGGETDQPRQIGDLRLGFLQPLAGIGQLALGPGELQRQHGGFARRIWSDRLR